MTLAVQLLAVTGVGLGLLLIAMLLYWIWIYMLGKRCLPCSRSDGTSPSVEDTPQCTCSDLSVSGTVIRADDGDGFCFAPWCPFHPNREIKVRLAGIDAPEMPNQAKGWPGQKPFDQKATDHLRRLVYDKIIYVDYYRKEQYNRTLAFAFVRQEGSLLNVNVEMVKLGLADLYEGRDCCYGDYGQELRKWKEAAKSNKIGFWSKIDEPGFETPRDYKRRMRAQKTVYLVNDPTNHD